MSGQQAQCRGWVFPASASAPGRAACGQALPEEEMVAYVLREVLEPIRTQR